MPHKPLVSRITTRAKLPRATKALSRMTRQSLRSAGCKACPALKGCQRMPFKGEANPDLYILFFSVKKDDLEAKDYLVDVPILDDVLYDESVRYGTICRGAHTFSKKHDLSVISECCHTSVVADIEKSKPKVVVACGAQAISWCLQGVKGQEAAWRGKIVPRKIGNHACWVSPVMDPDRLFNMVKKYENVPAKEWKRTLVLDIRRAISRAGKKIKPVVIDPYTADKGVEWVVGNKGDLAKVKAFLEYCTKLPLAVVDIETNCLRPYSKGARILTIAVGDHKRTLAFPFDHPRASWSLREVHEIKALWKKFLLNPVRKSAHATAFELEWFLAEYDDPKILRASQWHDSMAQAYIIDNRASGQSLDDLCMQHFGFNLKSLSNVNRKQCESANITDLLRYNGMDVKWESALFIKQHKILRTRNLINTYNMQAQRSATLAHAQYIGVPIDQAEVEAFSTILIKQERESEKRLMTMPCMSTYKKKYGKDFMPTSPPACRDLFKEVLGFGKKGRKFSCDAEALATFDHPAAAELLKFRGISKKRSTYIENMRVHVKGSNVWPDGRLHTSFNSTFTDTGRLSSSNPNMQNFPKRKGKETRRIVKPPDGCVIFSADYGQIEARVAGMASKDEAYCASLRDRFDIHFYWAKQIAKAYPAVLKPFSGATVKEKVRKFRSVVKNGFVFPAIYGSLMSSCARNLGVPENALGPVFEHFWDTYKTIREWQEELKAFYATHFYVECLTGRRRWGPLSPNQIINSPVQGSGSDIVMDAMDRLSALSDEMEDVHVQPVLNIHDDLTFFFPKNQVDKYQEIAVQQMLTVPFDWVNVPISIECEAGYNWYEMKSRGEFFSDRDLEKAA